MLYRLVDNCVIDRLIVILKKKEASNGIVNDINVNSIIVNKININCENINDRNCKLQKCKCKKKNRA